MTSRLETLVVQYPLPGWRMVAWPIIVLLTVMLVWANFAQLDEVATATGHVAPEGKTKLIQHLEGGIVDEIFVKEGDQVRVDSPLIRLNLATSGVNREELVVRLDTQLLIKARLVATVNGTPLAFPEDVAKRRPTQAVTEQRTFETNLRELAATKERFDQQIRQKELEVQELEAKQRSLNTNLRLLQERFKLSTDLLSKGLTPKLDHLTLQGEMEKTDGELKAVGPSVPRARAAVSEAQKNRDQEVLKFRKEAQLKLGETEESIARLTELLNQANDQGRRAEIKSPIDGIVKNIKFNTIGGIVKGGDPIMEIVPTGDKLVIEGRLNPTDRGYVGVGQKAIVKISTYDFIRYGSLNGEVSLVSADSSQDEKGNPYFRFVVNTDKTYLGKDESDLPITPGMEATIDIHTGKKSVMDFLIQPVLKLRSESFRER
jgi:adhesin transport system membrane fusion protein